ncbi:MAG: hypothetical protein IPP93_12345 [Chitinophagaceae bacterium]|nr:hypothetical protein [Chitinophagaceae bacterium]
MTYRTKAGFITGSSMAVLLFANHVFLLKDIVPTDYPGTVFSAILTGVIAGLFFMAKTPRGNTAKKK